MDTSKLRIIKIGGVYEIQEPILNLFRKPTGQWETIGNPDWAAIYPSLDAAQRQIRCWNGEDVNADAVVFPGQ